MALASKYISSIYAALAAKGLQAKEDKEMMVSQFTDGRTISVRDMQTAEAMALINKLNGDKKDTNDKRSKMIRTIYSYAHSLNMTKLVNGLSKVDTERLDALTKRLSPQKKGLQAHTYEELPKLVTIFAKYYKEQVNKDEV
jgi:hypothetical protein